MDCTTKEINLRLAGPKLSEPQSKSMGLFAQWLTTPRREKTGDDYYWLYQQQLQNSALQFNPLNKVDKLNVQELGKEEPPVNHESSEVDFAQEYSLPSTQSQATRTDYGCKIWTQNFAGLVKLVHDKIDQYFLTINPDLSPKKTIRSLSAEPLANKALTRSLVYKNHQLFIRATEAELSLNSAGLSKEQIKELSLLVKQWLNNKGIKLGHLVINGVKQ